MKSFCGAKFVKISYFLFFSSPWLLTRLLSPSRNKSEMFLTEELTAKPRNKKNRFLRLVNQIISMINPWKIFFNFFLLNPSLSLSLIFNRSHPLPLLI